MFTAKQKELFDPKVNQTTNSTGTAKPAANAFIHAGLKNAAKTTSLGNGAVKYTTTNNDFVDDFGKISNYKQPRSYSDIDATMRLLYSQDKLKTIQMLFYIRAITRTVALPDGSKTTSVQRGQGLKHEGIFRMMWLAINDPKVFWANVPLFIAAGGWKDIFTMLSYDLQYNGWDKRVLDWDNFGNLLLAGLENENTSNLVKKYLPQIKARKNCTTLESQADNMISKWICSLLFGQKAEGNYSSYKQYRKLKSSGTAHEWQQLISKGQLTSINFNTVAGRALAQLVSGKFLANNKLEAEYEKWIESRPVAKYTGYVYELMSPVKSGYHNNSLKKYQVDTINKQFMGLIETARKDMSENDSALLVVVDSSSSMTSPAVGTKVASYDVAKSMALYFSYLLKGKFENAWMEFNDQAGLKYWKGSTPVEKLQLDRSEAYGSTNFQTVSKTFVDILKEGVSESEFPKGILVVSDGCFNNSGRNKSETKILKENLLKGGFSKEYVDSFKICIWDIPNSYYGASQTAFEDFADCPNLFYMSGLDGSAIAFLTGTKAKGKTEPKNAEELFEAAMDQELLNMITV